MVLDLLACLPLQLLLETSTDYSSLIRVARLPRLYKMVKMAKLMRMLKLVKNRGKIQKYMNSILKVSIAFERLL